MKKHLMWMVCVAGLSCAFGGEAPLRSFRPEYRESDIYLPHLERIPLSGWWKLKRMNTAGRYVPMDPGKESRFAETGYADSAWEDDLVPNNLNSPFLKPHPDKSERTYGGVTWFRRNFTGPASGAGKRFILHFDEIFGDAELFLNGKKIGKVPFSGMSYHNSTEPPVEFDVTESIRCGALNTLAIRFYHSGKPVLWGDGIPNVLSEADTFVTGKKQKAVTKEKLKGILDNFVLYTEEGRYDDPIFERMRENQRLIDLGYIPSDLQDQIMNDYNVTPKGTAGTIFNYLMSHGCTVLLQHVQEF